MDDLPPSRRHLESYEEEASDEDAATWSSDPVARTSTRPSPSRFCCAGSLVRATLYVATQCLDAICGATVVKGATGRSYEALGGGANAVADGFTVHGALSAEVAGMFVLVYVILSATDPKRTARGSFIPVLVPLPIGFAVFAGAPDHHTHHRHRDQPGQEPRRRRHLQPAQSMETPRKYDDAAESMINYIRP
ncbi:hypothetical protein ACQ4PT_070137 [Festuca glaucescens]